MTMRLRRDTVRRLACLACLAAVTFAVGFAAVAAAEETPPAKTAAETDQRLPVPPAVALADSEKQIKDTFKDEYQKKTPADRVELAKRLLKLSQESKNDGLLYFVALREARDVAAAAGDLGTAMIASDLLSWSFAMDAAEMKAAAFATAARAAATPEAAEKVCESGVETLDQAAKDGQYDSAVKLLASLDDLARRSGKPELLAAIQARSKDIRTQQAEWAKVKPSFEKLKASPNDGDAALAVARYYVTAKEDWGQAAPLFAQCSAPALKAAAARELAKPADAAARADAGDLWWSAAEKESGPFKDALQDHAAAWYGQALGELTGLKKAQAEKRMQTASGGAAAGGATLMAYKEGLIRTIPTDDVVHGELFSPNGRTCAVASDAGIHLYDLESGKKIRTITTVALATCAAFSPDGARLVAAGVWGGAGMGEAAVWNLVTGAEQARFKPGGKFRIAAVTFYSDGRAIALGSNPVDDICRFHQVHDGKTVGAKLSWYAGFAAWNADSSTLLICYSYVRGYTRVLDGRSYRELREVKELAGLAGIVHVGLSRDGRLGFVSLPGTEETPGGPKIFDCTTGKVLQQINPEAEKDNLGAINSVALFPDNRRIATGHHSGKVVIWDIPSGKAVQKLDTERHVSRVAVSPDGRFLVVGGAKELRLYGVAR